MQHTSGGIDEQAKLHRLRESEPAHTRAPRKIMRPRWVVIMAFAVGSALACGTAEEELTHGEVSELEGRDLVLAPDSLVLVNPRTTGERQFLFLLPLRRGALIDVSLDTIKWGQPIESNLIIWDNATGFQVRSDVGGSHRLQFTAPADGEYRVRFDVETDPGSEGSYRMELTCQGDDGLCVRRQPLGDCSSHTLFLYGRVDQSMAWDACDVHLIGNFVDINRRSRVLIPSGTTVTSHGSGTLIVRPGGSIEARGTALAPVIFKALQPTGTWGGINLGEGGTSIFEHVTIQQARYGALSLYGQLELDDSVLVGLGRFHSESGTGIKMTKGKLTVRRSLITEFAKGMQSNANSDVYVEDSVITKNNVGYEIWARNASSACIEQNPVPVPEFYRADPYITHSDVFWNGIQFDIYGEAFFQIFDSNLRGSTLMTLSAKKFHPSSRVTRNNFFAGPADLVTSYHRYGNEPDFEGNYWGTPTGPGDRAVAACIQDPFVTDYLVDRVPGAGPRLEVLTPRVRDATLRVQQPTLFDGE